MDPPPSLPTSAPPLPSTVAPTASAATTIQQNHPNSAESSPRGRIVETWNDEPIPPVPGAKLRLMCSYGGHIMPRPHDKSLCYVGGDTRIVVVDRNSTLKDLCSKLSRTLLNGRPFALKYQLPNEELDNLITVTTDEDLDNMIEEYDRVAAASSALASPLKPSSSPSRLRAFLFFTKPESSVSMGSLLDDQKSETWFVDALNNSGILTRGVSDSAAGDSFVYLDGVAAGGSSNNLEAQGGADNNSNGSSSNNNNNKVKNLQDVAVNSSPCSPSSSSSPSMAANLPPIRVRVDDNVGSRLQQEQRIVGVMEEQFAQMAVGDGGGYVVVPSSAVAMPAIPSGVAMASAAMISGGDGMNRVVSDDERSDSGVPVGLWKPPLPLQLMQPRTNSGGGGGMSLPSPDSVASDSSSIASTNSFSRNVYYQEQVQAPHTEIKSATLTNAKTEIIPDQIIPGLQQQQQVQDPIYTSPPQLDQTQQLQQQFLHANTHYIHHPAATGPVPVSSYYPVYPPQTQQQQLHPPINQHHQYPVYVMPVGHTQQQQPYNMTPLQQQPQSVANGATPPIYPIRPTTSTPPNPAFVQIPSANQYVGLPQVHHQHPPQPIVVAPPPGAAANYGYEYGGHVQDQGYYTPQQQQSVAPLASQYQSMTPAAAAAALSDASKQFPNDNSVQQPNRTSQPV